MHVNIYTHADHCICVHVYAGLLAHPCPPYFSAHALSPMHLCDLACLHLHSHRRHFWQQITPLSISAPLLYTLIKLVHSSCTPAGIGTSPTLLATSGPIIHSGRHCHTCALWQTLAHLSPTLPVTGTLIMHSGRHWHTHHALWQTLMHSLLSPSSDKHKIQPCELPFWTQWQGGWGDCIQVMERRTYIHHYCMVEKPSGSWLADGTVGLLVTAGLGWLLVKQFSLRNLLQLPLSLHVIHHHHCESQDMTWHDEWRA